MAKIKLSLLQLLEQRVDLSKLINQVTLREEQLIDAALEQPSLLLDAGKVRVQAFHKRTLYEARLKLEESKAGLRLRRIRDPKGKKEFSEGAVKERIQLQPGVRKVRRQLDKAYAEEEMGKLLSEVFRQRSDSIRVIVNAGKVSVHAKELEILRTNKKLGRTVQRIRERWEKPEDEE